jgi:hypothetical protein
VPGNRYHFVTEWQFEARTEEVADILSDGPALVRWWPSVYLDVKELEHGDENRVGAVLDLYTKGWLPYTLRWQLRVTDAHYPNGFSFAAWGDFVGRGTWTFVQDGPIVVVTYDWDIEAQKPLLRRLSFLLGPVFAANHRWAMEKGYESLKLELLRQRATTPGERERIPAPPGAAWPPRRQRAHAQQVARQGERPGA